MSLAQAKGQRVWFRHNYKEKLTKSVKRAIETTRLRVFGRLIGEGSPVPYKTGALRLSVRLDEKPSLKGYATGLVVSWDTPYAEILVQWGVEGSHRARYPGTTLLYPQASQPILNGIFVEELCRAILKEGMRVVGVG